MSLQHKRHDIHTWHNGYEWSACLGEYDLGKRVCYGKTEAEAVSDLIDELEDERGELPK
jgi:hypothetical protein